MYRRKLIILSHLEQKVTIENGFEHIIKYHDEMIQSLLKQHFNKDVCILLITDFWQENSNLRKAVIAFVNAPVEEYDRDNKKKRNLNSVLFKISRNTERVRKTADCSCEHSFGLVNLGNCDTLSLILTLINDRFGSEQTILLTWDHGYGFGIFRNQPNRESIIKIKPLHSEKANLLIESIFKNVSNSIFSLQNKLPVKSEKSGHENQADNRYFEIGEMDRTDMLTSNELAIAIQRAFNKKQLDLLIFMNCNMMVIDELYSLSGRVKYVVGAESPISWIGYDYDVLIESMSKNNSISDIIKSLFESFKKKYSGKEEYLKWQIISSFSLEKMDKILSLFNEITLLFIKYVYDVCDVVDKYLSPVLAVDDGPYRDRDVSNLILSDNKNKEHEFYNLCLYDCIDLFTFIQDELKKDKLKEVNYTNLDQLISDFCVLITGVQERLLSGFDIIKPHNLVRKFNGVSIFFPKDLTTLQTSSFYEFFYSASGVFTSLFSQQSYWNEFVLLYSKYMYMKKISIYNL